MPLLTGLVGAGLGWGLGCDQGVLVALGGLCGWALDLLDDPAVWAARPARPLLDRCSTRGSGPLDLLDPCSTLARPRPCPAPVPLAHYFSLLPLLTAWGGAVAQFRAFAVVCRGNQAEKAVSEECQADSLPRARRYLHPAHLSV